jgi:hypothetical protein
MNVPLEMATSIVPASVPVHRWRPAEAASSAAASASCQYRLEDIGIIAIVVAELKLRQIHRQIFLTDVVVGTDNASLQERPKRLDVVGMHLAANV